MPLLIGFESNHNLLQKKNDDKKRFDGVFNNWPIVKTLLIVIGQTVLAKLAEQSTSNPKFEGSNPTTNVTRRNNNVQKRFH
jgi:hypothetical protein